MSGWIIYFICILDNMLTILTVLNIFSIVILIVLLIITIFGNLTNFDEPFNNDKSKELKTFFEKWTKMFACTVVILSTLSVFTPDTKSMVAIYMIPKITNNEKIDNMPDKMLNIFDAKLDEWMKDIVDNKKSKKENQ